MPLRTKIEWTDYTSNPIKFRTAEGTSVWACAKVSAGCTHCYSETLAKRYGRGGPFNKAETAKLTPYLCEKELRALLTSKAISGKRVFIGDMTDICGDWVPDAFLDALFVVMAYRSDVTFQLLTKRAERQQQHSTGLGVASADWADRWNAARRLVRNLFTMTTRPHEHIRERIGVMLAHTTFPLPNVWLGVSAEDQQRADEQIPLLLHTPAAVRFVSAEPLIGPIDFAELPSRYDNGDGEGECNRPLLRLNALTGGHYFGRPFADPFGPETTSLDWVIVGGESGPGARSCALEWIESIVTQCQAASVPVFVKQLGAYVVSEERAAESAAALHALLPHAKWPAERWLWRAGLKSAKGGDIAEFPTRLQVRQFPGGEASH